MPISSSARSNIVLPNKSRVSAKGLVAKVKTNALLPLTKKSSVTQPTAAKEKDIKQTESHDKLSIERRKSGGSVSLPSSAETIYEELNCTSSASDTGDGESLDDNRSDRRASADGRKIVRQV